MVGGGWCTHFESDAEADVAAESEGDADGSVESDVEVEGSGDCDVDPEAEHTDGNAG